MEHFEKNNRLVIALNATFGSDVFTSEKNGPYDTPIISYQNKGSKGTWFPWKYGGESLSVERNFQQLTHEIMERFEDNFKGKDVTELLRIARKLDK